MNSLTNFKENRTQKAYGSGLFAKKSTETKYSLFLAGTTTPFVFGAPETISFDILQSPTEGKLIGRTAIDDKEVTFMLHRDNVHRLEQFVGEPVDFMSVTADGEGWRFAGTVDYRPNDATGSDPHTGTFTIVASSTEKKAVVDIRPYIQDTVFFTNVIADNLGNVTNNDTTANTVNIECSEPGATIAVAIKDSETGEDTSAFTGTTTQPQNTSKNGSVVFSATGTGKYAVAYITVSKTGFAPWTTTVLLAS